MVAMLFLLRNIDEGEGGEEKGDRRLLSFGSPPPATFSQVKAKWEAEQGKSVC